MIQVEKALAENAAIFAAYEQTTDTQEYILPYSYDQHLQKLQDPTLVYLRILENNVLKGFFILALDPDGKSIEFRRIVVYEKGQGIGQKAIALMEQFCLQELKRRRIWLDVFEHNKRGKYIYEKMGYKLFGESDYQGRKLLLYQKTLE